MLPSAGPLPTLTASRTLFPTPKKRKANTKKSTLPTSTTNLTFSFFSFPAILKKFQQEVELTPPDQFGFSTVTHFDKYIFTDTDSLITPAPNSLVIHSDNQFFKPL